MRACRSSHPVSGSLASDLVFLNSLLTLDIDLPWRPIHRCCGYPAQDHPIFSIDTPPLCRVQRIAHFLGAAAGSPRLPQPLSVDK